MWRGMSESTVSLYYWYMFDINGIVAVRFCVVDGGFASDADCGYRVVIMLLLKGSFAIQLNMVVKSPGTQRLHSNRIGAVVLSQKPGGIGITAQRRKGTHLGITDPYDMGSAMAPAAADTISSI